MLHIRTKVLNISQTEMARIANVSQPTVSRWEQGELEPDRIAMQEIRQAAIARGIDWNDGMFFTSCAGPSKEGVAA